MKISDELTRRSFVGKAGATIVVSAFGLAGCTDEPQAVSRAAVTTLEQNLGRRVVTLAAQREYDSARTIWNALPDRKPAIIAPCRSAGEASTCIRFAQEQRLSLSIRSGGHHVAGFAMNTGGLVIDLSEMGGIKIDEATRIVRVGPAVRVGELAAATEPLGLVVPSAAAPTVGFGGMTTGGGEGWFGEYGLTLDCLLSAEVVTADGRILHVDKTSEPDLFWAIRGGSGNFGVVTSFELQAHPLPPLTVGMMMYPLPMARDVGVKWRDHVLAAAPDLTSSCLFVRKPAPAMMMLTKTGRAPEQAKADFDAIRALGSPMQDMVKPMTLTELQSSGSIGSDAGYRHSSQSLYLNTLSPELFDRCIAAIGAAPSDDSSIVILSRPETLGKIAVDATAYPHRGPRFALLIQATWSDAKDDAKNLTWATDFWKATLPLSTGLVYSNFTSDLGDDMAARAYGSNLPRLALIKRRYDPDNIFNSTINIKPA